MPEAAAPERRLRWIAVLVLGLALVSTIVMARQKSLAVVDVHNDALKSVGTIEEAAMAVRVRDFGPDRSIVIGLEWRSEQRKREDARETKDLRRALEGEPGIDRVEEVPLRSDRLTLFEVASNTEAALASEALLDRLRATAERMRPPAARVLVSGQIAGEVAIARAVAEEQQRVLPIVAGVLALLLLLLYRHVMIVAAILVPAGAAVLWTGGLHALAGHAIDPLSSLLEPVLLTVAVATAVHVVEGYLEQRGRGLAPAHALRRALRELATPAMWTAGTTIAGFLTLVPSEIPAVSRFGAYAAIGVALASLMSFTLSPAILLLAVRRSAHGRDRARGPRHRAFFRRVAARIHRRRRALTIATAGLFIAAALCLPRLRVDTDPVDILPASHAFRGDLDRIEALGVHVTRFDLVLGGRSRDITSIFDARVARVLDAVRGLEACGGLGGVPRSSASGTVLVPLLATVEGSAALAKFFDEVEATARAKGVDDAVATGTLVRVARDSQRLVVSRLEGLVLMSAALFLVFWLAFRSALLAALALVPNLLPAALIHAALAASGEALNVATAMIGSTMLGIVVDDTIHFVHRFQLARSTGKTARVAVVDALHRVGPAISITSIALVAGFLASLAGTLSTTRDFGWIAAATIALALVADLIVLPALLMSGRSAKLVPGRVVTAHSASEARVPA